MKWHLNTSRKVIENHVDAGGKAFWGVQIACAIRILGPEAVMSLVGSNKSNEVSVAGTEQCVW